MDFDPRSIDDSRDRDIDGRELNQGSRGGLSNPRERERLDPRDAFTHDLELPRGRERKRVWAGDSDVTLRGSEGRYGPRSRSAICQIKLSKYLWSGMG